MYNEVMCNMGNIREAYRLAHRGKAGVRTVSDFDFNKSYRLNDLQGKMQRMEWDEIFKYYRFTIYEPKQRIVDALEFDGRIIQHVLCDNILRPYFEPRLIKENCACRVGKGTHYANNLVKQDMVKFLRTHDDGYVLKMDVRKYFPSIDREVLKGMLSNFPDKEILRLLYWIIDHSPKDNGVPIGNQTSQWFALYYLNPIDRIIKERYRMKYYVRYMDDLIIIHDSKWELQALLRELREYARNELKLEFNSKTQIAPLHRGFSFLGWRYLYDDNKKIIKKVDPGKRPARVDKIHETQNALTHGEMTVEEYDTRMTSIIANLEYGTTYGFRQRYNVCTLRK